MLIVATKRIFNPKLAVGLCCTLAILASCSSPAELESQYCAEVSRDSASGSARRKDLEALDDFFDDLAFQIDNHLDSNCVKTYWGRDTAISVNVCTTKTIITTYGRNNIRNDRLNALVETEVRRLFSGQSEIVECEVNFGFSMTGWPDVESKL